MKTVGVVSYPLLGASWSDDYVTILPVPEHGSGSFSVGWLVNTSQIPIPFDHASLYFLEGFKSQMAGCQYHQDSYENAMLLSIECIASWSHPGVVQTNLAYLDLSCLSIPKRLRKYFSNFL